MTEPSEAGATAVGSAGSSPERPRSSKPTSGPLDDHGSTPAAWTAVSIIVVAFLVGAVGVWLAQPWLFFVGVGLVVVGIITGKVMQMMGLGGTPAT